MKYLAIISVISAMVVAVGCGKDDGAVQAGGPQVQTNNDNNGDSNNTTNTNNGNNQTVGTAECPTGNLVTADAMADLQNLTASVDDCVEFRFLAPAGIDPNLPVTAVRYQWFRGSANIAESVNPRLRIDGLDADDGGVISVRLTIEGNLIYESSALLTVNP